MPEFTCADCGAEFTLPQHVLDRYPGWTPRQCMGCRDAGKASNPTSTRTPVDAGTEGDPMDGVFTDGSSVPNPGPGGWAAVYVVGGEVVSEASGAASDTTNNRMELEGLIAAADLVPDGVATTVYSDSNLAVRSINEWAKGWKQRGWKTKSGPVKNRDLVERAYDLYRMRPELDLVWIRAHVGYTWNEYADRLANEAREAL